MARKRNVHLAQELSDNPEEFDAETLADEAPVAAAPPPVVPTVAPAGVDLAALTQMLANAMQTGMQGAIERTKPVVREVESEQRSVYNPEGNTVPRPALECPTFLGCHQKDNRDLAPSPIYDYDPAQCTNDEIRALNSIPAGRHMVRMYDGKEEPVVVQVVKNDHGESLRKVVAFPRECFEKSRWNMIPNVREIAAQVVGQPVG